MQFYKCALFCAILALSILDPITARKGFSSGGGRHSYPKSGGLSGGGGGHGYPSSGGLSGGGHAYPSSGGSHSYPSSGGSHGYPSSGGLSGNSPGRPAGYPSSGQNHAYPSSGQNHGYPSSGGSHGYPSSGGLSGNNNRGTAGSTTNVHHHYHYNPPQSIAYTSNGRRVEYPVYHGTPPTYVYKYKDSGSKYGTLLTGLALLNLGALAGTAYAVSQSHGHSGSSGGGTYKGQPGEVCKFGLKTKTSTEETRIDCNLILNFILAEQQKNQSGQQNHTIITSSTTVTNVTIVNNTNPMTVETTTVKVLYEQLPNGTFVAVTSIPVNTTELPPAVNASNPVQQSVVTTTVTNTTVVDALDVKGKPVEVTPDMICYVVRTTPTTHMRKEVPCQLLQTYADKSIQRNSASRSFPTFAILTAVLAAFVLN